MNHCTILKEGDFPCLKRCSSCCKKIHCPFCPPSIFKPRHDFYSVRLHLSCHIKHAVRARGFIVCMCHLNCRPKGHFHCPNCGKTVIRKNDAQSHINACPADLPKPAEISAPSEDKDIHLVGEISSTTTAPEPVIDKSDISSFKVELCSPQPTREHAYKNQKVQCPHCSTVTLRKNLKRHVYVKHKSKTWRDITQSEEVKERDRETSITTTPPPWLHHCGLLAVASRAFVRRKRPDVDIAACGAGHRMNHCTILKEGDFPCLKRCSSCCKKIHCPFCPPSIFKPRHDFYSVRLHLSCHIKHAVRARGFIVCMCHLNCRPKGHFHCPNCGKTVIRKNDAQSHINACPADLPKPAEISGPSEDKDIHLVGEISSTTTAPEPVIDKSDISSFKVELCSPQPTREHAYKNQKVQCPHCSTVTLRKNLKRHVFVKHKSKTWLDITQSEEVKERDWETSITTTPPPRLHHASRAFVRRKRPDVDIAACGAGHRMNHCTILKEGDFPCLKRCSSCCKKIHCPFCPPSIFKPRHDFYSVRLHLACHIKHAVRARGFIVCMCHLNCRPKGHFHCPNCGKTVIRKNDAQSHINACPADLPKPAEISAPSEDKDIHLVGEISSTTTAPEPVIDKSDISSFKVELCSPQPTREHAYKNQKVQCPHCSTVTLRKNLKRHVYVKHKSKTWRDITQSEEVKERDRETSITTTPPPRLHHCGLLAMASRAFVHRKMPDVDIAACGAGHRMNHCTILKEGDFPCLKRCSSCCKKIHCPFCPPSIFKPRHDFYSVRLHLSCHIKHAVRARGFIVCMCHLNCRPKGHFHCPNCGKTVIRKNDAQSHINACPADFPKPAEISAPSEDKDIHLVGEISSTTTAPEPVIDKSDISSFKVELCSPQPTRECATAAM